MKPYQLQIEHSIDRWDEAIPLGNGEMGCLVFGSPQRIVLALDRGDIWDRSDSPEHIKGFNYSNLKEWVKTKNTKAIYNTFDKPYAYPTPTKLPAGRVEISMDSEESSCSFHLDMATAECTYKDKAVTLKTYTHATNGVGMFKTDAADFDIKIVNPKFGRKNAFNQLLKHKAGRITTTRKLSVLKYPAPLFETVKTDGIDIHYYVQEISDKSCFGIALGIKKTKNETEVSYYAYRAEDAQTLKSTLITKVKDAVLQGYDALLEDHIKWWKEYNERSSVYVPDEYILNRYNMGNYLLGCASRKGCYPMPLQGLWTACDDKELPPWNGDYHNDLNTQMTYYSYLKANRLEQGECFIDYLVSLTDRAEDFAKKFYNAKGICLPSVMDIDGYALGGWAMYALSPTNQIWLCQSLERYYSYTGDKKFLKDTAYPYLEQTARFILSLLQEGSDGFYVLPLSSSPEIHDCTLKAFVTPNSNYDQSLLIYLFTALKQLAVILDKEDDKLLCENVLLKLKPLAVNDNNVLRISPDEDLEESHRHQSHAMAIHPLRLLDYNNAKHKKVIDATVKHSMNLGPANFTGYSYTWMGEFFAVSKNGDEALRCLEIFWKYFCSVNTFHLNGDYTKQGYSTFDYRPFTLEGNFCAQDVLQEMLLYSENGIIELFPAVAKKWKNVSFNTLRAWGGILVSSKLRDSKLYSAELKAECDAQVTIINLPDSVEFVGGCVQKTDNGYRVSIAKGETVKIVNSQFG
ncbi:glycosyl hydrolase family 95 catalytic domain-containing protein [Eubacterium sp.]|uniref:glycosyl hydrolase family 95 catalytic domain-containing protein n=1 Tax=Eubacterium sp. TaxID=142586 RepID=UPI003EFE56F2